MQAYCQYRRKESSLLYSGEVKIGIYACELWSPYAINEKLQIENVQRRATRFILDYPQDIWTTSKDLSSYPYFLLNTEDKYGTLFSFSKFELVSWILIIHVSWNKRLQVDIIPWISPTLTIMSGWREKTYFLRVTVLWNDLPQDLKCITLLTTFKREIINFFKTKLKHYCLPGK